MEKNAIPVLAKALQAKAVKTTAERHLNAVFQALLASAVAVIVQLDDLYVAPKSVVVVIALYVQRALVKSVVVATDLFVAAKSAVVVIARLVQPAQVKSVVVATVQCVLTRSVVSRTVQPVRVMATKRKRSL